MLFVLGGFLEVWRVGFCVQPIFYILRSEVYILGFLEGLGGWFAG
jgi:hypothetical protein